MVSRLLWECRGCIRDGARRNAAKPCGTGNSEFFPVAENGTKAALTTGMTTDRKIFDFPPCRDIMAGTEYPGVAKLVSRLIWVQETGRSSRPTRTKIPLKSLISEGFFLSLSIAAQGVKSFMYLVAQRNYTIITFNSLPFLLLSCLQHQVSKFYLGLRIIWLYGIIK